MVRSPTILGDTKLNKQVLQDFLSLFSSESTKNVYKWAMKKFLRFVADKHGIDSLDEYLALSLPIKECQGDVRRFFASIAEMPPKSQETIEGVLRSFFNEYNINIPNKWWRTERRRSKRKRARPLTQDRIPNTEELRKILSHMPIQGKALYLVLSSGGMRIGDAINIDLEDLNLNQSLDDGTPYHEILIFDQKSGNRRKVWITEEAVEAINEWLKVRQGFLIQACEKCAPRRTARGMIMFPHGKNPDDTRLFPFSTTNARAIWNTAIKAAEMDSNSDPI